MLIGGCRDKACLVSSFHKKMAMDSPTKNGGNAFGDKACLVSTGSAARFVPLLLNFLPELPDTLTGKEF